MKIVLFCDMFFLKSSFLLKLISFFLLFTVVVKTSIAQFKVDQVIPNEEKKKVERARKLFNEFKIYDGEKILKDLVKQHPYEAYYHEALVQIQRQVLRNIKMANAELGYFNSSTSPEIDSLDLGSDTSETKKTTIKKIVSLSDFGLDRNNKNEIQKTVSKSKDFADENPMMTDAVVTIDSNLLKEDLVNEDGNIESKKQSKEERARKKQLKSLENLSQIPYQSYEYDFIQNCRKATRVLNDVDSASYYLRAFLVDSINTDLFAPDSAQDIYNEALIEYYSKNIPLATTLLQKAIDIYPPFYNAHLYLGDCYFLMNKDSVALKEYQAATLINPNLPEAFEKLALHYYSTGNYTEAAAQIIEAISIYPQNHYFSLLKRIVSKTGKEYNPQWIRREVFPLTTQQNFEEVVAKEKTPWWHYQAAKQEVYSYYDTAGFVRPNEKTNERYLEIYGWKKMLNNSGKQNFPFARAMEKMGYLDCYVFITLFHHDLYRQFNDFVLANPEKVKQYFYILINWEDKKFKEIREEFEPKKTK